jgi:hypothetical protein
MQPFTKEPRSDEERGKLEQAIIAAFENIEFTKLDADTRYSKEMGYLWDTWQALERYYKQHDDPVISVRLVEEYMITTEALVHLAFQAGEGTDQRRYAFEALHALWYYWQRLGEAAIDWENE